MTRPNLFSFATSELSQDAMICWLAAWAHPDAKSHDNALYCLGTEFLKLLFDAHRRPMPKIHSLEVRRQFKNIDVLLLVNGDFAVCIEDKVGSSHHSNQLQRYVDVLIESGYTADVILPIYIQTFEQTSYVAVTAAQYAHISRQHFIALLEPYVTNRALPNAIVVDFFESLRRIDEEIESYRTNEPEKWSGLAWQGFFVLLQEELGEGDWGHVPNASGGFLGFWWHAQRLLGCQLYLQLEKDKLCFKISVERREDQKQLRDIWHKNVLDAGQYENVEIVRPRRLGRGQTMTVAVLNTDYRVPDDHGQLNVGATVACLKRAEAILIRAARSVA